MQTRGSTNKSSIKLSMQWKINWHSDLFTNRENQHDKNPPGDFKVTTLEIPLLSQQVRDNFSFRCTTPSTWLTNWADPSTRLQSPTREGCWLQSSSIHHTMKIKKMLGYKTLRCTNTATSSQEWWTRTNSISGHNLLEQTLLNTCATCVNFDCP